MLACLLYLHYQVPGTDEALGTFAKPQAIQPREASREKPGTSGRCKMSTAMHFKNCVARLSAMRGLQHRGRLPGQAIRSQMTYPYVSRIASGRNMFSAADQTCLQSRFMRKRGLPILPMKSLGDSGSIMCKPARDNRALSVGRLHRRTFASENGTRRLRLAAMSRLPTKILERTTLRRHQVQRRVPLAVPTLSAYLVFGFQQTAGARRRSQTRTLNEEARNHCFKLSRALAEKSQQR